MSCHARTKRFLIAFLMCLGINALSLTSANVIYGTTIIDFESLSNNALFGVTVDNQFAGLGVVFSNATAVNPQISLNESQFPPNSPTTVVTNSLTDFTDPVIPLTTFGLTMTLTFTTPVQSVAGFFTYSIFNANLVLNAFDSANQLLASVSSQHSNNTGCYLIDLNDPNSVVCDGDPNSNPNELLQIAGVGNIFSLEINPNGGDFTLDDLTFEPVANSQVPEPGSALLLIAGLVGFVGWQRRSLTRNRRSAH
jgi:hypothetical protein